MFNIASTLIMMKIDLLVRSSYIRISQVARGHSSLSRFMHSITHIFFVPSDIFHSSDRSMRLFFFRLRGRIGFLYSVWFLLTNRSLVNLHSFFYVQLLLANNHLYMIFV